MKIFYAVQATGNGHISRAMELIPHLQRYGTVDIFLSGNNSNLRLDAPVKYRSGGFSLHYNSTGGLNIWKIIRGFHPLTLIKEINHLPVEKYDLVINDFEFITAAACAKKKIPSIQLGHQASFQSCLTPRPLNRNVFGEWILKNYARASNYIGLHFDRYDEFIFPPVIKKEILNAEPVDKGHIVVYLPSYSLPILEKIFSAFTNVSVHIFSKETKQRLKKGNIIFFPVDKSLFTQSMIECIGIITGAGFETPAEALHLGKKILTIPTKGQYEQQCNAAALQKIGIPCLKKIDESFPAAFNHWLETKETVNIKYTNAIPEIVSRLFTIQASMKNSYNNPDLDFEYIDNPSFSV